MVKTAQKSENAPRIGRPPKDDSVLLKPRQLRLPPEMDAEVEAVARTLPDRQEWSAAVRTLLREALDARKAKGRK